MSMHIRKGGKFMKLKKKSGLMGAVIALSCASLVSVGFASWVISQGDSKTVDGAIIVDTVDDNIHHMTVSPTTGAEIHFTRPEEPTSTTYSWLSETTTKYESLSASFTVTVDNIQGTAAQAKAQFTATLQSGVVSGENFTVDTAGNGYLGAAAANYVIALPTPSVADGSISANIWTTTVTLTFGWGTYFGSQNPYYFYNAHKSTDNRADALPSATTYGEDAVNSLTALNTFLDGISYRLSLEFSAN